ncbi:MAG: hypothetical protein EOP42_32745 [Sphingobacteriaceae bacterium]|nr:MAG: hypothetical protein EOP42_32745 [Sphingobacteriaceae bacterium]
MTNERWLHVVEGHPEIAGNLNNVLLSIAAPEMVFEGGADELLAVLFIYKTRWLVVVYKENEADGFIITAYFTSKIDKLLKRKILWQK